MGSLPSPQRAHDDPPGSSLPRTLTPEESFHRLRESLGNTATIQLICIEGASSVNAHTGSLVVGVDEVGGNRRSFRVRIPLRAIEFSEIPFLRPE